MRENNSVEEWGNYGSKERLALRVLLEAYRKNPSNGNRHEQAIVDFISDRLIAQKNKEREEAVREERKRIKLIIDTHNARILNEFQLRGKPDMPFVTYAERVCLVPAMKIATEQTLQALTPEHEVKEEESV